MFQMGCWSQIYISLKLLFALNPQKLMPTNNNEVIKQLSYLNMKNCIPTCLEDARRCNKKTGLTTLKL